MTSTLPRLLVLTDRSQLHLSRGLLPTLAECREAGLTHVVLRELDEPAEQRAALAAALTDLGLTVIAAHAPLPGAAGVHLPSDGTALVSTRIRSSLANPARPAASPVVEPPEPLGGGVSRPTQLLGVPVVEPPEPLGVPVVEPPEPLGGGVSRPTQPLALAGRSCHTQAEVAAAAADGFDYATLGPFAATASKPGYGPPVPREAYADAPIPVYALGGITAVNAAEAVAAGAYGVAVMGAVMRAAEPARIVAALLETLERVPT